jgi:translation initiation factor IF-3
VNEEITARELRVIDPDGNQLGLLTPVVAIEKAFSLGMDLVEVAPDGKPPVCKIMDYGKYKYQQKKRSTEARKHQVTITMKEVKFRPKIEEHDYEFKVRNIRKFLEEGHKAKVTMMFRGREIAHADLGSEILKKIMDETKDVAVVEQNPKLEGRNMIMVLAPSKAAK